MCHVDFIATVAAIVGDKLPDNAAEDSVNVLPVLLGEQRPSPIREATVHHSAQVSSRFVKVIGFLSMLHQAMTMVLEASRSG